jgi:fumarate hydratase class II
LQSLTLLAHAAANFDEKLVRGLEANRERAAGLVEQSLAMVTVLAPVIGYDRAADIAKQAYATGRTVRELLLAERLLPEAEVARLLDPWSQTEPGRA